MTHLLIRNKQERNGNSNERNLFKIAILMWIKLEQMYIINYLQIIFILNDRK